MKNLGKFSGFKDLDTVLRDEADRDTVNKRYFVFVVENGEGNNDEGNMEILYTTDSEKAKAAEAILKKNLIYSTVWED